MNFAFHAFNARVRYRFQCLFGFVPPTDGTHATTANSSVESKNHIGKPKMTCKEILVTVEKSIRTFAVYGNVVSAGSSVRLFVRSQLLLAR